MSSVVALGHFCEVHGPRLVFYTIRNINEPQFVSQCPDLKFCSGCKAPLLEGYISTVQTVHNTPTQTPSDSPLDITGSSGSNKVNASVPGIPGNLSSSSSGQSVRTAPIHTSSSSSGRRRTSSQVIIDDGIGGSSSPATATTTTSPSGATKYYCSHSNSDHSFLSHLHTSISRTLSCELSPSNSVAFTSSDIWVIGTSFSLKDSQARGFHRRYCLIFTFLPESALKCCGAGGESEAGPCRVGQAATNLVEGKGASSSNSKGRWKPPGSTEYYSDGDFKSAGSNYYPSLVPYYEYITEEFYNIAKSLQSECEKVYFKEQSVSPQRAIRLSTLLDGSLSLTGGGGGGQSSSATVPGANRGGAKVFTRNHSSAAGARSLPLLTSNPHVFLDLHEKFARVLHHVDLFARSPELNRASTFYPSRLNGMLCRNYHRIPPCPYFTQSSYSANPALYRKFNGAQLLLVRSIINQANSGNALSSLHAAHDGITEMSSEIHNLTVKESSAIENEILDSKELQLLEQQEIWDVSPAFVKSYNFAPFANDSEVIKKLVQLGVELHRWEKRSGIPEFILKLDFDKNIAPYIRFLCDQGVEPDELGKFFTKNPFILQEEIENLGIRIKYLQMKKFDPNGITRILCGNPFWLSFSTQRIDKRLGFFQEYFQLTGNQVREVAIAGPKLITFKLERVKSITFTLKERMGFEPDELKQLLITSPGVFRADEELVWRRFDYLHNEIKFTHEQILRCPKVLMAREGKLRHRIGFLQHLGRIQFNPKKPNFVSMLDIIERDDATFATRVAHSSAIQFNDYLKSL